MVAIQIENLSKERKEKKVLIDVNLNVEYGQCVALVGPNGSGKSTLLKILGTLIKPTKGNAWVNGFSISKDPVRVRESIGFAFQTVLLDKQQTINENLLFTCALFDIPKKNAKQKIAMLLEIFHLTDLANIPVKQLSGGMARLVDIVRAIIHNPRIILLDEPTAGLDSEHRKLLFKYLHTLQNDFQTTILFSTHQLDETTQSSSIFTIKQGFTTTCTMRPLQ